MGNQKIRGKDLKHIKSNKARSLAMDLLATHSKYLSKVEKLEQVNAVFQKPEDFLADKIWSVLARELVETEVMKAKSEIDLLKEAGGFKVFGRKLIDSNAYQQMELAMRLPVALKGAMMPDAHQGYGLPIGGVLATRNEVIPYGVGMDIGCRMALSIYDIKENYLKRNSHLLKMALQERTAFGLGEVGISQEHEILDRKEFTETKMLRDLHGKAAKQLGSSGSGNHFVEWGVVELFEQNELGLEAGNYLALLSHSGSRGMGASIARHYTQIAMNQCLLPRTARHLAWLDLDSEEGMEYWLSMNLAGDYAKACHDRIHLNLNKYVGIEPAVAIENHHNFAWKEKDAEGNEMIVHRKGATPAAKGELGVIPATMVGGGYIVRGKGAADALQSASHGAGRKMSRKHAKESFTRSAMREVLKREGVTLLGGGVDEAPIAYKDIEEVMKYQTDLVETIGRFCPKIVRMDKP